LGEPPTAVSAAFTPPSKEDDGLYAFITQLKNAVLLF